MIENDNISQFDNIESNDSKYNILIADYDKPTLKLLKLFFESNGYSSYCVRNGTESLKKLCESKPKLILLDIMLPDISAFELCKQIKSNNCFKDIPIIFLTSIPVSIVIEKFEDTKADGCITKPFAFESLEFLFKYLD